VKPGGEAGAAPPASSKAPNPTVSPAPEVGAPAPDFALPGRGGKTVRLGDFAGKRVVLYFYPRDNTPGCTVEALGFRDHHAAIEAKGAVIVGVSRDSTKSHENFCTKFQLPFELLSDPTAETIAAYGSWGEKQFMGRRFMGIVRTTVLIGADGLVAKVYGKVSPKVHAEEILADLDAV